MLLQTLHDWRQFFLISVEMTEKNLFEVIPPPL